MTENEPKTEQPQDANDQPQEKGQTPTPGSPGSPDSPETAEAPEEKDELTLLQEELQHAKIETALAKEQVLRANADYQNMARRSLQNISAAREEQALSMSRSLVGVMDHFDQALAVDPEKTNTAALLEGVQIVRDELMRAFESFGVKRIDAVRGDEFDPNIHEAMMRQKSEELDTNQIAMQIQPGYLLNDKTLRPAKVAVAE